MTGYAYLKNVLPEVYDLEIEASEALQKALLSNQQHVLVSLVKIDDPDIKQEIITQNLRRVVNIAKRYSEQGVAILDLIREGIHGLIYALENFEREGGFRFESYAVQCVRRSIERAIMNQNNPLSFNS